MTADIYHCRNCLVFQVNKIKSEITEKISLSIQFIHIVNDSGSCFYQASTLPSMVIGFVEYVSLSIAL